MADVKVFYVDVTIMISEPVRVEVSGDFSAPYDRDEAAAIAAKTVRAWEFCEDQLRYLDDFKVEIGAVRNENEHARWRAKK